MTLIEQYEPAVEQTKLELVCELNFVAQFYKLSWVYIHTLFHAAPYTER